jgi:hypothetical protein
MDTYILVGNVSTKLYTTELEFLKASFKASFKRISKPSCACYHVGNKLFLGFESKTMPSIEAIKEFCQNNPFSWQGYEFRYLLNGELQTIKFDTNKAVVSASVTRIVCSNQLTA